MTRTSLAIWAAALALAAAFAAQAAGLGRLTVLSPLGSPLEAEIEIVSLQPGDVEGLTARLAPAEAFSQAGIEPSAALSGVRFAVVRRQGRPVLRVTSSQPMNEPFVDLLVELEWSGGRLVREYTFLLDPPGYKSPGPIAAAPASGAAQPSVPAASALPRVETPAQAPAEPQIRAEPLAPASAAVNAHEVKRGETLGEIARANLPPGASLNQMLIALYRANPESFIRENINLVRAGQVLSLPSAEEVAAVEIEEADQLVRSHRAEWNDYRNRLAAQPAPVAAASGQRAVAGKIAPNAETLAPAGADDKLRLAQADPAKPGASASRVASDDDAAARERALQEAQSRVSELEKNVADLQKLLELKNQQLAELEKKAAPPAAAAPAPATAAPAQPAAAPAPQPKAAPVKAATPAAPPPPSATLLDDVLENPVALAGLGAILVLLLGYALWARRKKAAQAKFSDSVLGAAGGTAPSFNEAGASAGGSQASVSQGSGMEAEEVDPIAEADVYMAYGRDAQAEEILKEALQKDANRIPVHAKLLEIYAKRSDLPAFEQTALKLKNLTNGSGPDWDKASALGRSIDPGNGLYGGSAAIAGAAAAGAAAAAAASSPAVDFDIGGGTSPGMVTTDIPLDEQPRLAGPSGIDFDLGAGTTPPSARESSDFTPEGTLKLDQPDPDATVTSLDFDLGAATGEHKAAAAQSGGGLDFDLNLDLGTDKPAEPDRSAPPMDLSSISLDLGSAGEPVGAQSSNDPKWHEVATKLDLAKAYEEMGDKDGARELLGEVMKDGDAAQKGQAEQLLTKLG